MSRRWIIASIAAALGVAAVLALLLGGVIGRHIAPSPPPATPATVRFEDAVNHLAVAYPSSWERRTPRDQAVRVVAASADASASLSLSVRRSGLEPVTAATLAVVRPLTDDLIASDTRIHGAAEPSPVTLGGLPGYRYRYSLTKSDGRSAAHVHYFLFKGRELIQLVLQAEPAQRLTRFDPTFDDIAASFDGRVA